MSRTISRTSHLPVLYSESPVYSACFARTPETTLSKDSNTDTLLERFFIATMYSMNYKIYNGFNRAILCK